jgi:transcription termination/antitermination protein NusG
MRHYAIQVFTDSEEDFLSRLRPFVDRSRAFVPKRVLEIRKQGKKRRKESVIFPGYVFVSSEDILADLPTYWAIRKTQGFIRYLRDNSSPTPLSDQDERLLRHFMSFGERADTSRVTFDEDDRIVVLDGPLKGLEGRIVRVDRRKGRAKVSLDMCETGFLIDLGFRAVERVVRGGEEPHAEN